ncbi:hypothetical protein KEM56_006876 [Ascosphaera pollenicola]|nr:hypothetical protein KEM56_006876 [Ascosphaera pollenicola]
MRSQPAVIDLTAEDDSPASTTTNTAFPTRRRSSQTIGRRFSDDSDVQILLPNQTRPHLPPFSSSRASRPPRFGRDIINPVDLDSAQSSRRQQQQQQQPSTTSSSSSASNYRPTSSRPSISILNSPPTFTPTPLQAPPQAHPRTHAHSPAHAHAQRQEQTTSNAPDDSSDEVTFIRERVRQNPIAPPRSSTHLRQLVESLGLLRRDMYPALLLRTEIQRTTRPINRTLPSTFTPASYHDMDYDVVPNWDGTYLMVGDYHHDPPAETPPVRQEYHAPEAPAAGFTRKISEDEVVVCPNCDHELGSDGDDAESNQVWVVKQCGHVYCGLCAHNRKKSARQPHVKSKPFSKCVVEGCGKNVASSTAMVQIYL